MKTEEILAALAKRLRSRAEWCTDGWYSSDAEIAKNAAMREVYEAIAEEIEGLLLPAPAVETEVTWTPEHEVERWRALVADLARTKALYDYDHKRTWSAIDALVDALDGFDGELLARVLKDVKETP